MRYLPVLVMLMAAPALAASVWKWRDANGVVHYSDQPVKGAEQVRVQGSSTYSPPPAQAGSAASGSSSSTAPFTYSNVEIWKPSNEATVANTAGVVSVAVRVEPALAAEHHLALYMDDRLVPGFPERGVEVEYALSEVERGTHTLVLAVLDAKGAQIRLSNSVTFFMQQPSVLLRPR